MCSVDVVLHNDEPHTDRDAAENSVILKCTLLSITI